MNGILALGVLALVSLASGVLPPRPDATPWAEKLVGKELLPVGYAGEVNEETQFRTEDLPSPYRLIRPRQGITMDYRTDRLNVQLDSNEIVTKVYYG